MQLHTHMLTPVPTVPHLPCQTVLLLEEIAPLYLERPPVAETNMCNAKEQKRDTRCGKSKSLERCMAVPSHYISVSGAAVAGSLPRVSFWEPTKLLESSMKKH